MKVYISSHSVKEAVSCQMALSQQGHEVTSEWFDLPRPVNEDMMEGRAIENLCDIDEAEVIVMLSGPDLYPGGKFLELGYALAKGKKCFIVGRRENIMSHHPSIRLVADQLELIEALK